MKLFIINISIFSSIILLSIYALFWTVDGYSDDNYLRFTSDRQESLILGTSKAAQGLQPQIFNKNIKRTKFYNYSFSVLGSPYGEIYLNSILKKVDSKTKKGIFILTIDPWSISAYKENPNDKSLFTENEGYLAKTTFVNKKPNIEYLLFCINKPYYSVFIKKRRDLFLHDDGWLEVNIDMTPDKVKKRISNKIDYYNKYMLPIYDYSETRFFYLEKTIETLRNYGDVYLVRLPIHNDVLKIENELMPDFDSLIDKLVRHFEIPYYDMASINIPLRYTDGNHLYKESGKKISELLSLWILDNEKSRLTGISVK